MASTLNIAVTCTGAGPRTLSADMRREWGQDVVDVLRKIISGNATSGSQLVVSDGATVASGTATFSGTGTATDTVTVGGVAFTAVASGATGNQWNVGATAAASATNLAAAINASATAAIKGAVVASVSGAVVTITAAAAGPIGNFVSLAKSSTAVTVSGATLTGGTANTALLLAY